MKLFNNNKNELKKKVKEYKEALKIEEDQKKRLLSKDLDYQYLEELVKRCENNKDLIIEIETADHSHITIKTDRKPTPLRSAVIFDREDT